MAFSTVTDISGKLHMKLVPNKLEGGHKYLRLLKHQYLQNLSKSFVRALTYCHHNRHIFSHIQYMPLIGKPIFNNFASATGKTRRCVECTLSCCLNSGERTMAKHYLKLVGK